MKMVIGGDDHGVHGVGDHGLHDVGDHVVHGVGVTRQRLLHRPQGQPGIGSTQPPEKDNRLVHGS